VRVTAPSRVRRVSEPGARARSRYRGWAVLGMLAAAVVASSVYLALPGGGKAAAVKYGGIPSWLPTPSQSVGRVVQASAAHPWLAIEGDSVRVHLAAGQVLATAVGPQVPEEGQFPVPATTPCTFMVTFTAASGSVPVNPAAFTALDEQGRLHRLSVRVQGGGAVPASVPPGHTVTLLMSAVLPTGSGTLRWTPSSTQPIVSWDFDVEID
jgi:hypothetical protein